MGMNDELRARLRKALEENAADGTENRGLHGWRCAYPEAYGPCDCVDRLLDDLVSAALGDRDALDVERLARALRIIPVPATEAEWQAAVDRSYESDAEAIARAYDREAEAPDELAYAELGGEG